MKRIFLLSAIALLAAVGCSKNEAPELQNGSDEIAVAPFNGNAALRTKGYSEGPNFYETLRANLHSTTEGDHNAVARKMQLSAYLYPQNGEQKNYFVGKTYAKGTSDDLWHAQPDPVYWPVGGTMDFLAYSLSGETGTSKNINAVWNNDNAAKQVVLTVPGENTQNDILFASVAGIKSSANEPVDMKFNHAQAWLEFALTGAPENIVHLQKIELENVYNAGTLTISNNSGNAVATWDFKGEDRQNIAVDNFNTSKDLTSAPMYLDMLIPQQTKTNFVLYYTLGSDTKVLQYRFGTDLKTWLMGEKYVYNIAISTSEVTVSPTVTSWEPAVIETESIVKVKYDDSIGIVAVDGLGAAIEENTYKTDTWGATATLTATPNDPAAYRFDKWSDGNTENPRTVTITDDVTYEALFTDAGYTITANVNKSHQETPKSLGTVNGVEAYSEKWAEGATAKLTAAPIEGYKFFKWMDGSKELVSKNASLEIEVNAESEAKTYTAVFIPADAIPAEFSVSATKKVFFSKGNLQAVLDADYDSNGATTAANPVWKFAEHQYDFIGNDTGNTTLKSGTTIDLFGWSAANSSGVPYDTAVWGISKSNGQSDYGSKKNDVLNDWGKNMKIGDDATAWRTMTGGSTGEWKYLLDSRQDYRFAKAKIANPDNPGNIINGLLIFPDGYDFPGDIPVDPDNGIADVNTNNATWDSITGFISSAIWSKLEASGVVFLPAAGYRNGSTVSNAGNTCYYWSSTPSASNQYSAYNMYFNSNNLSPSTNDNRYRGSSVRLVSEL